MSDALMQRHEAVIQSRLATVTKKLDEAIDEGKTSVVFYVPDGIVVQKPSKWFDPSTWGIIELAGWGLQLKKILEDYGLQVAFVLSRYEGSYVQGYIKGTEPVEYGEESSRFWLDRSDSK